MQRKGEGEVMMSEQIEKRQAWLSSVYNSAIKHGVFSPADVLTHVTPEVLALDLPKELVVRLFDLAFEAGKMTPLAVLGVAPPSTLVKYVAPVILWGAVRAAAARQGIAGPTDNGVNKSGKSPVRAWLTEVVASALEKGIITAADVTRHIPPSEWVRDVPVDVVARLISAGLSKVQFDPRLVLEVLTPQVIGEFVTPFLAWGLIEEGAVRAFDLSGMRSLPRRDGPPVAGDELPPPPAPGDAPVSVDAQEWTEAEVVVESQVVDAATEIVATN